jgi:hypothetical protein
MSSLLIYRHRVLCPFCGWRYNWRCEVVVFFLALLALELRKLLFSQEHIRRHVLKDSRITISTLKDYTWPTATLGIWVAINQFGTISWLIPWICCNLIENLSFVRIPFVKPHQKPRSLSVATITKVSLILYTSLTLPCKPIFDLEN